MININNRRQTAEVGVGVCASLQVITLNHAEGWSIWVWQQVIKAEVSDQGEKQGEENFQLIWSILCYGILH